MMSPFSVGEDVLYLPQKSEVADKVCPAIIIEVTDQPSEDGLAKVHLQVFSTIWSGVRRNVPHSNKLREGHWSLQSALLQENCSSDDEVFSEGIAPDGGGSSSN